MGEEENIEHVDLIREVFHYSRRFKGSTFVIKIDSPVIGHEGFPVLARDLALLHQNGMRIVIVPGARERIDQVLDCFAVESKIHNGTRIASEKAIPFIKMAAFDVANKVMTSLSAGKVNAVIGNWVKARAKGVIDGIDCESAGVIDKIDTAVIEGIMDQGLIPIFPCIGWNSIGKPYNISSDELAAYLAETLNAEKLFYIRAEKSQFINLLGQDIDGVVSSNERVSRIDASKAGNIGNDILSEDDNWLLKIAVHACSHGVERVQIINGTHDGELLKEIFSNKGSGTLIHANLYDSIRSMHFEDIAEVLGVMNPLAEKRILVLRTRDELSSLYEDYIVYDIDGTIHGCAALHRYSEGVAEIAGLAVDQSFKHLGIGKKLVNYLIEQARSKGFMYIFVFTTQSEDWFLQFGFQPGTEKDLPAEREYNEERNSKILIYRLN